VLYIHILHDMESGKYTGMGIISCFVFDAGCTSIFVLNKRMLDALVYLYSSKGCVTFVINLCKHIDLQKKFQLFYLYLRESQKYSCARTQAAYSTKVCIHSDLARGPLCWYLKKLEIQAFDCFLKYSESHRKLLFILCRCQRIGTVTVFVFITLSVEVM
jgi:hypothetical protein